MALHQWDRNVDRPPVGARQIVARYYRHRRARRRPEPWAWWPLTAADWTMLVLIGVFALGYLLADWWTSFLPIGR